MENRIVVVKATISLVGGMVANFLGGYDSLLRFFVMAVIIDFFLGILNSIKKKQFSSTVARWGFVGKLLYFMMIALCVQVDQVIGKDDLIRNVALAWFLICECASILENSANLGMPLPKGLTDVLIQVKTNFSVRVIDIVKKLVVEYCGADSTSADMNNTKTTNEDSEESEEDYEG